MPVLCSFHSEYIALENDICRSPAWNKTKSAAAFVALQKATRAPAGIARFPDGGMPKSEYANLVLYSFDVTSMELSKHLEFTDLTGRYHAPFRDTYQVKLVFADSLICYHITVLNRYGIDSTAQAKYSRAYALNINSKNIAEIDTSDFFPMYRKTKERSAVSLHDIKTLLSDVSPLAWGIVLKDIYPLPDREYMNYIIYRKGSELTRECIFEQIVPGLHKKDTEYMYTMMEKYQNELYQQYKHNRDGPYRESLKRSQFEQYAAYITEVKGRLQHAHSF